MSTQIAMTNGQFWHTTLAYTEVRDALAAKQWLDLPLVADSHAGALQASVAVAHIASVKPLEAASVSPATVRLILKQSGTA